jgi:protein O-GlcNAc transferase
VAFHNVNALSNAELAQFIEEQAIDLLVDLNTFSRPTRLPPFALRPAPVQVAWFNLFAHSGTTCFDYLIGNAHLISAADEIFYSETIVCVPGSYIIFQVSYPVPDVTSAPCLKNGHLTFGCFAPQYKITTPGIEAWSRILRESPTTRLILKNVVLGQPKARDFLHGLFARFSIPAERVEFDGPDEHYSFLERYADIDVALDAFPYNGGTTTTEALWQGVPVLAFVGDRWGRGSAHQFSERRGFRIFLRPILTDLSRKRSHSPAIATSLRSSTRYGLQGAIACRQRRYVTSPRSRETWKNCIWTCGADTRNDNVRLTAGASSRISDTDLLTRAPATARCKQLHDRCGNYAAVPHS